MNQSFKKPCANSIKRIQARGIIKRASPLLFKNELRLNGVTVAMHTSLWEWTDP